MSVYVDRSPSGYYVPPAEPEAVAILDAIAASTTWDELLTAARRINTAPVHPERRRVLWDAYQAAALARWRRRATPMTAHPQEEP